MLLITMKYRLYILLFCVNLFVLISIQTNDYITCTNMITIQQTDLLIYIYKPSMNTSYRIPSFGTEVVLRNKTILIFVDFRNCTVLSCFELLIRINVTNDILVGESVPGQELKKIDYLIKYHSSNMYMVYSDILPLDIKTAILNSTTQDMASREYSERISTLLYTHFQNKETKIYPLEIKKTYNNSIFHRHTKGHPLQIDEREKFTIRMSGQSQLTQLFGDHIEFNVNYLVSYNDNICEISNIQLNRFKLHSGDSRDWVKISSRRVKSWVPMALKLFELILDIKDRNSASKHHEPVPSTSYNTGECSNIGNEKEELNSKTNPNVATRESDCFQKDDSNEYMDLGQLENNLTMVEQETEILDDHTLQLYLNN